MMITVLVMLMLAAIAASTFGLMAARKKLVERNQQIDALAERSADQDQSA